MTSQPPSPAAAPAAPPAKTKSLPPDAAKRTEAALKAFHEEGALGKAYDARLLQRLWPFMRPYQAYLWLSIGLGVVMAGLALLRPYIMRMTIDAGALAKDREALLLGGAAFAGVIVIEQILNFIQVYTVQISGARALADPRAEVFGFLHGRRLAVSLR